MAYRRKPTRPPRQVENDERDQLKAELARLQARNRELMQTLTQKELENDLLLEHKARLGHELSGARGHIAFLQGQMEVYR